MEKENDAYNYFWRKAELKSPKKWDELHIAVNKDCLSVTTRNGEKNLPWDEIKAVQIIKTNAIVVSSKIICHAKENTFYFNNQYATTLQKFEMINRDFTLFLKTVHATLLLNNPDVQYTAGDRLTYVSVKVGMLALKIISLVLMLLGLGMILNSGVFAFFLLGVSIFILAWINPVKAGKPAPYDPKAFIEHGMSALKL